MPTKPVETISFTYEEASALNKALTWVSTYCLLEKVLNPHEEKARAQVRAINQVRWKVRQSLTSFVLRGNKK